MIKTSQLVEFVTVSSVITTTVEFCLALLLAPILQRSTVPRSVQGVGVAVTVLVPILMGAAWMFRHVRPHCTRREALAVTIAFGTVAPVSLAIGTLFAPIPGGYAAFLGRPFGLIGAFVSIVVAVTMFTFAAAFLALHMAQRFGGSHQTS